MVMRFLISHTGNWSRKMHWWFKSPQLWFRSLDTHSWYTSLFPSCSTPSSSYYIHRRSPSPIPNNVTHIHMNAHTYVHLSLLPAPPWEFPSLHFMLNRTLLQRLEENQNAFHYHRVCEGVIIIPLTKKKKTKHTIFSPNAWKDLDNLTKSPSCFLLSGGRPKHTYTQTSGSGLALASFSKASQPHDLQIQLLGLIILLHPKCLSTLLLERPRMAPKSGSGVVARGGVPSAGHFDKAAACFSVHTRKCSRFKTEGKNFMVDSWDGNRLFLLY